MQGVFGAIGRGIMGIFVTRGCGLCATGSRRTISEPAAQGPATLESAAGAPRPNRASQLSLSFAFQSLPPAHAPRGEPYRNPMFRSPYPCCSCSRCRAVACGGDNPQAACRAAAARDAADGCQDRRRSRPEACSAVVRVRRDRPLAALDDDSAAGRRLHQADPRPVRAIACAPGSRSCRSIPTASRPRQRVTESQRAAREADLALATQQLDARRRSTAAGAVARAAARRSRGGAQERARRSSTPSVADPRGRSAAAVLPGDGADRRHRRRHSRCGRAIGSRRQRSSRRSIRVMLSRPTSTCRWSRRRNCGSD